MAANTLLAATIPEQFAATAAARREQPALGAISGGKLTWLSWGELSGRVSAWSAALAERGVGKGDRVAQISPNCVDWILADLALHTLGAVHVPLHAALAVQQTADRAWHSDARLVLARDADYAGKLRSLVPAGVRVVLHSEIPHEGTADVAGSLAKPSEVGSSSATGPDDLATILYTSGTTGTPLGVMLSQRNLVSNARAITEAYSPSAEDARLVILPLSHIYARTCDLYSWLMHGGRMVLAESRDTIFRDCELAAPASINAVPYFYQKVVDRLREAGGATDAAALAKSLGGGVRRLFCGGAALAPEIDRFFSERGLPIHCGFGLTEASPVISATAPGGYRSGTVGPPLAGVDVRLADDGEVMCSGPGVMLGYWKDEQATARVLREGWLRTGDLGEWDAAGHLQIVGRKKEMIVLATGKKVAPTRIEQLLAGSPWIEQACVVGDGHKCLAALVVPNGDMLRREIKRRRLLVWSKRRALTHPKVLSLYREEINQRLAGEAQFEQIAAFTLLDRVFSLELGEVTPKLSLCRVVIQRQFATQIAAMYRSLKSC